MCGKNSITMEKYILFLLFISTSSINTYKSYSRYISNSYPLQAAKNVGNCIKIIVHNSTMEDIILTST